MKKLFLLAVCFLSASICFSQSNVSKFRAYNIAVKTNSESQFSKPKSCNDLFIIDEQELKISIYSNEGRTEYIIYNSYPIIKNNGNTIYDFLCTDYFGLHNRFRFVCSGSGQWKIYWSFSLGTNLYNVNIEQ